MTPLKTTLSDLLAHNRWANQQIARLCAGLSPEQMEMELPLGLGTFRATFWHICGAEEVWLARWLGASIDPASFRQVRSCEETTERLQAVDQARQEFLAGRNDADLRMTVAYRNFAGEEYSEPLAGLILHVANHGVHHRAQLLHFLKHQNRHAPGGLDYIFYRMSSPTVAINQELAQTLRAYGLSVGDTVSQDQPVDRQVLRVHHGYGTWMMNRLLAAADELSDADLDRDFSMGAGTLRKTLAHVQDAENFWLDNYAGNTKPFPEYAGSLSVAELRAGWHSIAARRTAYFESLSDGALSNIVTADFGAGQLDFRVGESMLQLASHGTHHRAQAINMLRQLGVDIGATDLVVYLRSPDAVTI